MITRFVDLSTMTVLDKDKIVSNNANGIVYYSNNIWRFIPTDKIRAENVDNINVPVTDTVISNKAAKVSEAIKPSEKNTVSSTFYSYYFGLTEAMIASRKYKEESAFVSDPIDTEQGGTYTLIANFNQPDKTSIEFYIIDGIKETAILPFGYTEIQNEKLFLGLPLRFNAEDTPVLYRDFELISDTLDTAVLTAGHLFTANYKADEDAQYITVSNSSIKIKAVLRCYEGAEIPPTIKSIILQKGE